MQNKPHIFKSAGVFFTNVGFFPLQPFRLLKDAPVINTEKIELERGGGAKTNEHIRVRPTPSALLGKVLLLPRTRAPAAARRLAAKPERQIAPQIADVGILMKRRLKSRGEIN